VRRAPPQRNEKESQLTEGLPEEDRKMGGSRRGGKDHSSWWKHWLQIERGVHPLMSITKGDEQAAGRWTRQEPGERNPFTSGRSLVRNQRRGVFQNMVRWRGLAGVPGGSFLAGLYDVGGRLGAGKRLKKVVHQKIKRVHR